MPPVEISFKGGLNTAASFLTMPSGQCLTFQDMVLNYGSLVGRNSIFTLNSASITSGKKVSLTSWIDATGGNLFIYCVDATNAKIYRSSSLWQDTMATSGVTFSDVTGTAVIPAGPGTWDSLNNILVHTNSAMTNPVKFTSNAANAANLGGTPPTAQECVKVVNNYMFLSGSYVANTSKIYWSNASDPETWPAANNIDFLTKNGDGVRALGAVGTDLLVFKGSSVGKLSTIANGTTLGPFSTIWDNVGVFGPNCVDNLDDGTCVFWGSDGDIYHTDGYVLRSLARLPPPQANIFSLTVAAGTSSQFATLRYYSRRKEIWISAPFVPFALAYDIDQKYWRKVTGLTCWGLTSMKVPQGYSGQYNYNYLLGSSVDGNVLILDNYVSNTGRVTNETGGNVTAEASTSVLLPPNVAESGVSGLSIYGQFSASSDSKFYVGYDNTYQTTPKSLNVAAKTRFDFPRSALGRSNSQQASTMQLKITTSYNSETFDHVYANESLGA